MMTMMTVSVVRRVGALWANKDNLQIQRTVDKMGENETPQYRPVLRKIVPGQQILPFGWHVPRLPFGEPGPDRPPRGSAESNGPKNGHFNAKMAQNCVTNLSQPNIFILYDDY